MGSHKIAVLLVLLFWAFVVIAHASEDILLRQVIEAYQVVPHKPSGVYFTAKERLGQALFFDPFVSGPKQIACGACHVRSLGAGDRLPLAVGIGASGVSTDRLASKSAFIVPRNALPFFNRGSDAFVALFWDGRVQKGSDGRIESPLGNRLPTGFENPLAAASVFPLAEPDEMLGRSGRNTDERTFHGELVSPNIDSSNLQERTLSVFNNVMIRLLSPHTPKPDPASVRYRRLFEAAYPGVSLSEFRINHVGNSLAAYIRIAFELQPAHWDRYVNGDADALTAPQKRGALVFFGKGRCAVCHSGTQFSDFRFHGLAIPQMRIGKSGRSETVSKLSAEFLAVSDGAAMTRLLKKNDTLEMNQRRALTSLIELALQNGYDTSRTPSSLVRCKQSTTNVFHVTHAALGRIYLLPI